VVIDLHFMILKEDYTLKTFLVKAFKIDLLSYFCQNKTYSF